MAIIYRPGDFAIVAHATVLAVDDLAHGNFISSRAHFKSQFMMTDLASKPNPMKPVGKNNRAHIILFRHSIQYDIRILGTHHG